MRYNVPYMEQLNQIDLNLLKLFNKIAEVGSFTKAAQSLNIPKSTVSRSISRLEKELNVQLIKRSTRAISLTEEGNKLYRNTHTLFKQLHDSLQQTLEMGPDISGILSLSLPEDFAHHAFSTILTEFSSLHPSIKLKINLSNTLVDLTRDEYDLAIRIGKLKDSTMIQRQIGEAHVIPVATKSYLDKHGVPKEIEDLTSHRLLSFYNENSPQMINESFPNLQLEPFFLCNSFPMLKMLTLDSQGIAFLPNFLCQKDISLGKLVPLLPNWEQPRIPIQVIYPYTSRPSQKIRAFIDYLASKNINYF